MSGNNFRYSQPQYDTWHAPSATQTITRADHIAPAIARVNLLKTVTHFGMDIWILITTWFTSNLTCASVAKKRPIINGLM